MSDQRFVHLRLKTQYSQLNSILRIKDIVKYIEEEKSLAVGITDDMNASGAFRFSKSISDANVKPVIGLNVIVIDNPNSVLVHQERAMCITLLAMNEVGYRNILNVIYRSQFNYEKTLEGNRCVKISDIEDLNEGLICLSGGYNGLIASYLLSSGRNVAEDYVRILHKIFGDRFYIELTRHGREREKEVEDFAIEMAYKLDIPLVATNDVHFFTSKQFDAYDAISCVKDGKFVSQENRWRLNKEFYLKSEKQMIDLFSDIPEAIDNTVVIARRCSFMVQPHKPMLPSFVEKDKEKDIFFKMAREGLSGRLNIAKIEDHNAIEEYKERLEYEMEIISKMDFVGYFLIVCDFVRWAKSKNIPVGPGRGSGAGSIVAWCLDITNVDPIRYGLIFERFLNPERVSMPDFDIDFCQTRRHEVVEYVLNKYGKERVGSIITFGKLQAKAALKDIGRVLQMPYRQIDEMCKLIPFNPIEPVTLSKAIEMDDRLRKEALEDSDVQNLIDITLEVEGLNRHSSTHAAGVVITSKPLIETAPVHKESEGELSIIGFDMKDSESVGLVKFDFLGLKTLSVIDETLHIIKDRSGKVIDINAIDEHEKNTLDLLKSSKTKGVFQLEATVPREALQRIEVDGVKDISAITSLNRPGPMAFISDYIKRKNGNEKISYPHSMSKEILEETYGIMIYQEQVMKMARVLADYSLGEADLLRRAMGKKIKAEMDKQEERFVQGAKTHGISQGKAKEIFESIAKFAGYGFNKSHSIAYSIISYQTAYLKANYTVEFFTAMANLDYTHDEKIVEIVSDARNYNIEFLPPNINTSKENFVVKSDKEIIYGMGAIKSVSMTSVEKIVSERNKYGNFIDIFDFISRCGQNLNRRQFETLIKSGCFDELNENRKVLLAKVEDLIKYGSNFRKEKKENQVSLFGESSESMLPKPSLDVNSTEKMTNLDFMEHEFEAFGFYLKHNPIYRYKDELKKYNIIDISEINNLSEQFNSKVILLGGVITKVKQRSGIRGRFAFITIADLSGMFELAIFNESIITTRREIIAEGKVVIVGVIMKRDKEMGLRLNVLDVFDVDEAFQNNGMAIKELLLKEERRDRGNRRGSSFPDKVQNKVKEESGTFEYPKKLKQEKYYQLSSSENGKKEGKVKQSNYSVFKKDYVVCVVYHSEKIAKVVDFIKDNDLNSDQEGSQKLIIRYKSKNIQTNLSISQKSIKDIREKFNLYIA